MRHVYIMVNVKEWNVLIDLPNLILRWQQPYDNDERENIPAEEIGMTFVVNAEGKQSCIHYVTGSIQPERSKREDTSEISEVKWGTEPTILSPTWEMQLK